MTKEIPETMTTEWPVGPAYTEWVHAEGPGAWVAYKLRAANWFIEQLHRVGRKVGFFRYVGIEMALDGALAELCGAFDAAVGGLIASIDAYFDNGPDGSPDVHRTPIAQHSYSWGRCKQRLRLLAGEDLGLDTQLLIKNVDKALRAAEDAPLGWLVELQRLRNGSVHRNTLARHIDMTVDDDAVWSVSVQGRSEQPVEYLRRAHGQLTELTVQMVDTIDRLSPNGVPTERRLKA